MVSHSSKTNIRVGIIGGILVALIMIVGTLWMGHSASDGTKQAVQSVSLFQLDKFAFVDENGLIYTSTGTKDDIDTYPFDPESLSEAEIYVKDINEENKTVIIAVPVDSIPFKDHKLKACFMEIAMDEMLQEMIYN